MELFIKLKSLKIKMKQIEAVYRGFVQKLSTVLHISYLWIFFEEFLDLFDWLQNSNHRYVLNGQGFTQNLCEFHIQSAVQCKTQP